MAKTKAADTDELVKQALLKIATADGPVRLSGKGEHPAVFASTVGGNKKAIDRLKDEAKPLVVEPGKGKAQTVALTAAGFEMIAGDIPEDKVGAAARALAESLPAAEQVAFLQEILPKTPAAAADLEPLLAEAIRRQEAESEARIAAEREKAERGAKARVARQRCLDHLARLQAGRVEELKAMLLAAGGTVPEAGERQPDRQAAPETGDDRDFRRDVAERLVSSWRDAVSMKKDEARRFLETALDNISGLRRIGEEGEEQPFDGSLHRGAPGVFTEDTVRITRSGWALEDGEDREYVIEKALVEK